VNHIDEQTVLYRGPLRTGLGEIVLAIVSLAFLSVGAVFPLALIAAVPVALIGLSAFLYSWISASRTSLVITTEGVRMEAGLIVRNTEVVDFARVQDVALTRALGWETLVLHGSDVRTPRLSLCFHGAAKQFDVIRGAVLSARRRVVAVQQI
jgi:uncharacterized membrane protein YdbT with pleckstrin-like domain